MAPRRRGSGSTTRNRKPKKALQPQLHPQEEEEVVDPVPGEVEPKPTSSGYRINTRNQGRRVTVVPKPAPRSHAKKTPTRSNTSSGRKAPWEDDEDAVDAHDDYYRDDVYDDEDGDDGEADADDDVYVPENDDAPDDEEWTAFDIDESSTFATDADEFYCPTTDPAPPPLKLPVHTTDIIFPMDCFMDLVKVYDAFMTFYRTIQLTPFMFEDFCGAVRAPEQSKLLAEIHIALLRIIYKSDDEDHTQYAIVDTTVSFQLLYQLLEPVTYGEVLRQYAQSDKRTPGFITEILNSNYPFVSPQNRIYVLQWLLSRFFETTIFHTSMKTVGKIEYDQICRLCAKPGNVMLCDGCEACYHPECMDFDQVPDGTWYCPICELNNVEGACVPNDPPGKYTYRKMPLGYDRHGRIYWFIVRRIVVQNPTDNCVMIYSHLPALYDLISSLDANYYERRLCHAIFSKISAIETAFRTTWDITQRRCLDYTKRKNMDGRDSHSYLSRDSTFRMSYLNYSVVNSGVYKGDPTADWATSHDRNLVLKHRAADLLGFRPVKMEDDGSLRYCLMDPYWTNNASEELLEDQRISYLDSMGLPEESTVFPVPPDLVSIFNCAFRLGLSDSTHNNYVNHYESDERAKNPTQRAKERERKKYFNTKFSLDEAFSWSSTKQRSIMNNVSVAGYMVQFTIKRFVDRLPDELFHRNWRGEAKEAFFKRLINSSSYEDLRIRLLEIEAVLRMPVFVHTFWNSLGHMHLVRVTSTDRDQRAAAETKRKKDERDLLIADPTDSTNGIVWVNHAKGRSIAKTMCRVRHEGYRINGRGALGGWIWLSSTYTSDWEPPMDKPALGIDFNTPEENLKSTSDKKASKLDKIAHKLGKWRERQEFEALRTKKGLLCISPTCNEFPEGRSFVGGLKCACYAQSCPWKNGTKAEDDDEMATAGPVKAYDPQARRRAEELKEASKNSVPGVDVPLPMNRVFDFMHPKAKISSIFVLPKWALRKLCRNIKFPVPGFNHNAKSNFIVWNYPSSRPIFDNCWRFQTRTARSLHAVALQFRMLFICIRWNEFVAEEIDEHRAVFRHPEYEEIREVIEHKEFPPDGYFERYKVQIELVALEGDGLPQDALDDVVINPDVEGEDNDATKSVVAKPRSIRKSTRRKATKKADIALYMQQNVRRKVIQRWMNGVDLKIHELITYWKMYNERLEKDTSSSTSPASKAVNATESTKTLKAAEATPHRRYQTPRGGATLAEMRKRPRDSTDPSPSNSNQPPPAKRFLRVSEIPTLKIPGGPSTSAGVTPAAPMMYNGVIRAVPIRHMGRQMPMYKVIRDPGENYAGAPVRYIVANPNQLYTPRPSQNGVSGTPVRRSFTVGMIRQPGVTYVRPNPSPGGYMQRIVVTRQHPVQQVQQQPPQQQYYYTTSTPSSASGNSRPVVMIAGEPMSNGNAPRSGVQPQAVAVVPAATEKQPQNQPQNGSGAEEASENNEGQH